MVRTWRVWPQPTSSPESSRTRLEHRPHTGCTSERSDKSPAAAATPCAGIAGSQKSAPARPPCPPWGSSRVSAPTHSRLRSHRLEHTSQPASQLLLQPCRRHGPTARQRPDYHLIGLMEIAQHGSGDMPQPAGDPVPFHGRTHRLADNEPDARSRDLVMITPRPNVNDDIGLHHANPVLHRRVKLR